MGQAAGGAGADAGGTSAQAAPDPESTGVRPARDRVLDAARELFYRDGIRAVGVEAVVERAGVTKMSLYRHFGSKDALVGAYLEDADANYWRSWDRIVAQHDGDPRAQIRALFERVMGLALRPGYRGCPFTNAAIEFPDANHPGRQVAEANKRQLRQRLRQMAARLVARDPVALGDGLLLLLEGAYASSQTFGPGGPAIALLAVAEALIDGAVAR